MAKSTFKMRSQSAVKKSGFKMMGSSPEKASPVKRKSLYEREEKQRDAMQRQAARKELRSIRKQRRSDTLADKGRGRRSDRKYRKAQELMHAAEDIRGREKDIYARGLERDYGYTPEEIKEEFAWEYDPAGRRYGQKAGQGKGSRRRDITKGTWDEAAHEKAYAKYEKENPITKTGSPAKNYKNPQDYKVFNYGNKPTPVAKKKKKY